MEIKDQEQGWGARERAKGWRGWGLGGLKRAHQTPFKEKEKKKGIQELGLLLLARSCSPVG